MNATAPSTYRGRLAPSPTGYLHLGHARTFWVADERARAAGGKLVLRNDDLDRGRVRAEFVQGFLEDLHWFGCRWEEGPDVGGAFGPYNQSERLPLYREAFERLRAAGWLYPCTCSRKDILSALSAPHAGDEEPLYPGTCRTRPVDSGAGAARANWRFRVPASARVEFHDLQCGAQCFVGGVDFGDFVVWRQDDLPSYQLACVVDDARMQITEVVRGEDLLLSTARQWLLYEALGWRPPAFYHCPLVRDAEGRRLAKRHDSLSLRALRERGWSPEQVREQMNRPLPRLDG